MVEVRPLPLVQNDFVGAPHILVQKKTRHKLLKSRRVVVMTEEGRKRQRFDIKGGAQSNKWTKLIAEGWPGSVRVVRPSVPLAVRQLMFYFLP